MPREIVTVSVGQAGNQIGHRFWELAVTEHAAYNADGLFHDSMSRRAGSLFGCFILLSCCCCCVVHFHCRLPSCGPNPGTPCRSFFRNVDASGVELPASAAVGGRPGAERRPLPIVDLRARAVIVDMEEGVVGGILVGPGLCGGHAGGAPAGHVLRCRLSQ